MTLWLYNLSAVPAALCLISMVNVILISNKVFCSCKTVDRQCGTILGMKPLHAFLTGIALCIVAIILGYTGIDKNPGSGDQDYKFSLVFCLTLAVLLFILWVLTITNKICSCTPETTKCKSASSTAKWVLGTCSGALFITAAVLVAWPYIKH